MYAPTHIHCLPINVLAAEDVVTKLVKTAHPELPQAALLTAALTPGRPTAATGISASSSAAISQQLWLCLKLNHRDPPSLMSTDGHQMDNGLARAMGQPLAVPPRRLVMFD